MNTNKFILSCISNLPLTQSVSDYSSWLTKNTEHRLKLLHTIIPLTKHQNANLSGSIGISAKSKLLEELIEKEHKENKERLQKGKDLLQNSVLIAKKHEVKEIETCLRKGHLIETLKDFEHETAITVIGRYGQGSNQSNNKSTLGLHVEKIIKSINSPILVVAGEFKLPENLMVLYNNSSSSRKVLQLIVNNGAFKDVKIHVININKNKDKSEKILELASNYLTRKKHPHECHSLNGEPLEMAAKYSRESDIDMIVMGAYGHNSLLSKLFGSFTNQVLKECHKPILLVR